MYFLCNADDQSITAFKTLGAASKEVLQLVDVELPTGEDPVRWANQHTNADLTILNLSAMLESIANSDDGAAQELAGKYKDAIDMLFAK